MRLQGKVALITGAASGMGKSEAEIFAKEGAKVVVADVLDAEGKAVADGIGTSARYVHLDVTSEPAWEQVVATTVAQFGKLDILVNNAGISGTFDADIMSTSAWDKLMDVNAKGVFLGMKSALPVMVKAGAGSIVNISSVSGFVAQLGLHMGLQRLQGRGAAHDQVRGGAVRAQGHSREFGAPRRAAGHAHLEGAR
jgi:NAD(P)-dependent dehydrogenase (short-subunit alcohol dehydrogenase family)